MERGNPIKKTPIFLDEPAVGFEKGGKRGERTIRGKSPEARNRSRKSRKGWYNTSLASSQVEIERGGIREREPRAS